MKHYSMSGAAAFNFKHDHPERTTGRGCPGTMNFDVFFEIWPTRKAMARAIRKQEDDMVCGSAKLHPVVKLSDGEGF
jgi:hypothetical protein